MSRGAGEVSRRVSVASRRAAASRATRSAAGRVVGDDEVGRHPVPRTFMKTLGYSQIVLAVCRYEGRAVTSAPV